MSERNCHLKITFIFGHFDTFVKFDDLKNLCIKIMEKLEKLHLTFLVLVRNFCKRAKIDP